MISSRDILARCQCSNRSRLVTISCRDSPSHLPLLKGQIPRDGQARSVQSLPMFSQVNSREPLHLSTRNLSRKNEPHHIPWFASSSGPAFLDPADHAPAVLNTIRLLLDSGVIFSCIPDSLVQIGFVQIVACSCRLSSQGPL